MLTAKAGTTNARCEAIRVMAIALIGAAVVATIYFTLRPARFGGLRLNSVVEA